MIATADAGAEVPPANAGWTRATQDPHTLAKAARIVRAALARKSRKKRTDHAPVNDEPEATNRG